MNSTKQRKILFIICFLFLIITFASLFYIVKEENHYCTGENCPICANIHQAEQTLRTIGSILMAGFVIKLIPVLIVELASIQSVPILCKSLVSQKVRLNH